MEFAVQLDGDFSEARSDRHAAVEQVFAAQQIQCADKFSGMIVEDFTAFFELIEFFKNCYGDDDVVFRKLIDTGAVVKDDVGVKNERGFLFSWHRLTCDLS